MGSQQSLLKLSRTASVVGGLLWVCLAPVLIYADSELDEPGTAESALAASSIWLAGVVSLLLLLLGLWQFGREVTSGWADWDSSESWPQHSRSQRWPWGTESSSMH